MDLPEIIYAPTLSVNGNDVRPGVAWVTEAAQNTILAALDAAVDVLKFGTTATQL